jgi:carboxymethylenebutenolidase
MGPPPVTLDRTRLGDEVLSAHMRTKQREQRADIGAVFDEHVAAEFVHLDLEATMSTMTENPYVNHVPVMTGGVGRDEVRDFYGRHFIGKWPTDTKISPVSRTIGDEQVVDELVLSFTHDIEMDQLLPGVAPTGRHVQLAFCVVAKFEGDKLGHEHIYWDQASLLAQVGLLDPIGLPVTGAEQAGNVLDPRARPLNELIRSRS